MCFFPHGNGKPVVVLSNNDSCIISRSNEAKALEFPWTPEFQVRDLLKQHNIRFSSNYALYGDLVMRMKIL